MYSKVNKPNEHLNTQKDSIIPLHPQITAQVIGLLQNPGQAIHIRRPTVARASAGERGAGGIPDKLHYRGLDFLFPC